MGPKSASAASRRWILIVCLLATAGCGGRSEETAGLPTGRASFLSAAESAALADPDTTVFAALADQLGADRLIQISGDFLQAVFGDSTLTATDRKALLPAYRQVTTALECQYECPEFDACRRHFLELDPAQARTALDLARRQREVLASTELDATERLEHLAEIQTGLEAVGYYLGVAAGLGFQATVATRAGRPDLTRVRLTEWLAYAREHELRTDQCSALASLIMQGFAEGNTDSTGVLLDRGLRLARASRLAEQTGRLLVLTGYRDFSLGHYSSAVRLFEESVAACRNYGSPAKGLSYLGMLMRMYAVMESWTLVDQVAQRAELLLIEAQETGSSELSTSLQTVRQGEIRARSLMARGHVEEADAAYGELWDQVVMQPFEEASFVANYWIMGLLDHQRPDLAAAALDRAEPYAREAGIRHMLVRLPFWKARNDFQHGRLDSAMVELDRFAAEGLTLVQWTPDLQIPYRALRVRLLAATGADDETVSTALAEGLVALTDRLEDNDAGAGAFLDLSRARGLRWAAHDILGADPVTGYGLELMWRRYLDVMGGYHERPFSAETKVATEARSTAERTAAQIATLDAVHLLYQVREPYVVRWIVGENGSATVRRDTLQAPFGELRGLVGGALQSLSTDPGDPDTPIDEKLAADLGRLAELLLPSSLLAEDPENLPHLLLVSGESFLSQIPFAPLNVAGDGRYVPLASRVELSWVRNPAETGNAVPGDSGLIVADPHIDSALVRRYRTLGPLPGAGPEATAVAEVYPSRLLEGAAATKTAVSKAWSDASMIYFIGHVIHNPEVPFLTTIPLTPPDGPHLPIDAALDIADVRSADLHRCRLVVLSGCGSGAPFADGVITAPSLGDAFLDAGAGAALQTFWRIRDERPFFRPEEVVRLWKRDGLTLPAAVAHVQRRAMDGPRGVRHPFGWGAWTLKAGPLSD